MRRKEVLIFVLAGVNLMCQGFFGFDEVRFFDQPKPKEEVKKDTQIEENIFAEPVIGPDGKIRVYVPPKVVLDFLNNPTPENAKEYLKWNKERISKIAKAQMVLEEVAKEEINETSVGKKKEKTSVGITQEKSSVGKKEEKTSVGKKEMAVALSPDCKYCKAEIFVLEAFKKKYPTIDIKLVWFGSSQTIPTTTLPVLLGQEVDKSKIKKFPTFYFVFPDGRVIGGEGFIDGRNLEEFCKRIGFL